MQSSMQNNTQPLNTPRVAVITKSSKIGWVFDNKLHSLHGNIEIANCCLDKIKKKYELMENWKVRTSAIDTYSFFLDHFDGEKYNCEYAYSICMKTINYDE